MLFATYADAATCTECINGYAIVGGVCTALTATNCIIGNADAAKCAVCDAGYYLEPTAETCLDV